MEWLIVIFWGLMGFFNGLRKVFLRYIIECFWVVGEVNGFVCFVKDFVCVLSCLFLRLRRRGLMSIVCKRFLSFFMILSFFCLMVLMRWLWKIFFNKLFFGFVFLKRWGLVIWCLIGYYGCLVVVKCNVLCLCLYLVWCWLICCIFLMN